MNNNGEAKKRLHLTSVTNHRLGALSACLLDDLAGAQRTKQGQL